nr:MAG TPA: hypothetical protein [Caudoviricetes sp.]
MWISSLFANKVLVCVRRIINKGHVWSSEVKVILPRDDCGYLAEGVSLYRLAATAPPSPGTPPRAKQDPTMTCRVSNILDSAAVLRFLLAMTSSALPQVSSRGECPWVFQRLNFSSGDRRENVVGLQAFDILSCFGR